MQLGVIISHVTTIWKPEKIETARTEVTEFSCICCIGSEAELSGVSCKRDGSIDGNHNIHPAHTVDIGS